MLRCLQQQAMSLLIIFISFHGAMATPISYSQTFSEDQVDLIIPHDYDDRGALFAFESVTQQTLDVSRSSAGFATSIGEFIDAELASVPQKAGFIETSPAPLILIIVAFLVLGLAAILHLRMILWGRFSYS